jgi:hypothetical protein
LKFKCKDDPKSFSTKKETNESDYDPISHQKQNPLGNCFQIPQTVDFQPRIPYPTELSSTG